MEKVSLHSNTHLDVPAKSNATWPLNTAKPQNCHQSHPHPVLSFCHLHSHRNSWWAWNWDIFS
jgi:hypothetical protein